VLGNGANPPQEQEQRKPSRDGNPRWLPGVSGNPVGRESREARHARRARLISEWAAPFGGMAVLQPAELDLLHQAAELALRKQPRKAEDAVRVANVISKILQQCRLVDKRRRREPQSGPTLAQYLGQAVRS
jgi:hypothetical protein